MNSVATIDAPRTRLDSYMAEVLPPEKKQQLANALPRHIRPELFERNLMNALMAQPDLLKCDPREVWREVAQIAALGLFLDPALGEAYLITGYSTREGRHKPQRRVGYRGLVKLARQSGEISMIYAHEICADDHVEINLGINKQFDHRLDVLRPRGPIVAFYGVAKYRDGDSDFEIMLLDDVNRIRDRSDAWKAWKAGKVKKPPPWETDAGEMGKKTVLRRLLKRVPQSPELAEALKLELDREDESEAEVEPLRRSRGRPKLTEALTSIAQPRPPQPAPIPPPQPIPPQPDDDWPPPLNGDEDHGPDADEPDDPLDIKGEGAQPGATDERARLLEAAHEKAKQGSRKLKWWRARLTPEQEALLGDWSGLEEAAKAADG